MEIVEPIHIEETSYTGCLLMATERFRNTSGCHYGRRCVAEVGFLATLVTGIIEGGLRGSGYILSKPIEKCLSQAAIVHIDQYWKGGAKASFVSSWISIALLVQNLYYPALDARTLTLAACPACTANPAGYIGINA